MSSLFHYCTVETLKAILKNKTIRLSDIRKSNDSKEINFLFDEYCKWVEEKSTIDPSSYVKLVEYEKNNQLTNTVFLVSCLSRKEDDLHMWSCYGNEGVCIEFEEEKLKKQIERVRIVYEEEDIIPTVPSCKVCISISKVEYHNSKSLETYFTQKCLKNVNDFITLFYESPTIKSDFFKCEEEFRIIYTLYIGNTNCFVNHLSLVDENNKIKRNIPFDTITSGRYQHKMIIDIPIDMEIVKSITIGPNCRLTQQDVNELLFINGIKEIDIKSSRGSYR